MRLELPVASRRLAVLLLCLAAGGATTPPQQSAPAPTKEERDFVLSSDVDLVLLDVSVKDAKGGFTSGLTQDNFKVFEDGKEQQISVFAARDVPVTVGLVVDNSSSVRPKRPEIVTAALTFVSKSNPDDEMFVVNFNERATLGLPPGMPFAVDMGAMRTALLGPQARGRTAIFDALKLALEHLQLGSRDKKTLILISDGGDNSSDTTEPEIFRLAEESAATIYSVGIYSRGDRDKNPGFLKKLASITGGEYFQPEALSQLVSVCEKIAQDIRSRYSIGYVPANRNFDGNVRKLKVAAEARDRGKLSVRTRTHYVASNDEAVRRRHRHR